VELVEQAVQVVQASSQVPLVVVKEWGWGLVPALV
jgi:hypothetical protein